MKTTLQHKLTELSYHKIITHQMIATVVPYYVELRGGLRFVTKEASEALKWLKLNGYRQMNGSECEAIGYNKYQTIWFNG